MANKQLESLAISVFCENMAMMLGAGIGAEEAAGLLGEDSTQGSFHDAAKSVQKFLLLQGGTLSEAVAQSGYFPAYVSDMIRVGESAGRIEQTLRSLAGYYASRSRLETKLKSAVLYPLVLLVLMAAILGVLLAKVLPVFAGVYTSLAGDLTSSSYGYIRVAYGIGWLALAVTVLVALVLIAATVASRTSKGLDTLKRMAEHLPVLSGIAQQLSLANFTEVLMIYVASGVDVDSAMEAAGKMVDNETVAQKVDACRRQMKEKGVGLATAVYEQKLFEPLYGRMLVSGARSGSLEPVLERLTDLFSQDARMRIDRAVDRVEPFMSAFLTVTVGIALISTMLPLIGILGSIG
ncbi:type II secretion system F family protein [Gemmiger formicilis]|uniref:type II secretion system F family protein n=1 Tax=Gemmiger formicilis TaxID=745368 RepID=UPI001957E703|nr:type II secretion system F family protein [Gemmiger formicilis]MBM6716483.1 type II secretion system F family protein [Gemmiger formicilis]